MPDSLPSLLINMIKKLQRLVKPQAGLCQLANRKVCSQHWDLFFSRKTGAPQYEVFLKLDLGDWIRFLEKNLLETKSGVLHRPSPAKLVYPQIHCVFHEDSLTSIPEVSRGCCCEPKTPLKRRRRALWSHHYIIVCSHQSATAAGSRNLYAESVD